MPLLNRELLSRPWLEAEAGLRDAAREVARLIVHNQQTQLAAHLHETSALLDATRGNVAAEVWGASWMLGQLLLAAVHRGPDPQLVRELGNPLVQEIVGVLADEPDGLQMNVLGERVRRHASVVSRTAARMAEHLVVSVHEEGRSKILRLTPEARRVWSDRQDVRDGQW